MLSLLNFLGVSILVVIFLGSSYWLLNKNLRKFLFQKPPENSIADVLPFLRVNEDLKTMVLKDGSLVQVIALDGVDFSTLSEGDEQRYFTLRKNLLNEFAQNPILSATLSYLSIKVERSHVQEDTSCYPSDMLKIIHEHSIPTEQDVFDLRHVMVVTVPMSHPKQEEVLHESVSYIMNTLHSYHPKILTQVENRLFEFWQHVMLEFESTLHPKTMDIQKMLSGSEVTFNDPKGYIRHYDGITTTFGQVFSLMGWGDTISGEFLRDILTLRCPLQILQFIHPVSSLKAEATLEQQKKLSLVKFNRFVLEEFQQAIEEVQSKEESLFQVSTHIYVFHKDLEVLQHRVSELKQIAATHGVRIVPESQMLEYLWFARFPSYTLAVEPLKLLTSHVAAAQEFHASPTGLLSCDWGKGALRTFQTVSGSKYALQLHVSERREELAHALVIAPSNSGKTTLFQHLIGGALRFPNLRAFMFDRLRGTQIFTESMGGIYMDMGTQDFSLNPFQMELTLQNRRFLHGLLIQMSGIDNDKAHDEAEQLLNILEKTPVKDRTLFTGYNFGCRSSTSDFSKGIKKWAIDESYRHIFKGPEDRLNLEASPLIGFEMTEIQRESKVASVVLNYVLYRIRQLCAEGSPHMIFIDETAPMLLDPMFKQQVAEMLREHRKLRGAITVCFQNPGDMEATGLRETILNQCQTVFLFQNPQAKPQDYAMFDLTESQWEFIKGISSIGRRIKRGVLVKKPNESVIIDIDLSHLGPYLKLYRSGNDAVAHVHQLKSTYGEKQWIQEYLLNG